MALRIAQAASFLVLNPASEFMMSIRRGKTLQSITDCCGSRGRGGEGEGEKRKRGRERKRERRRGRGGGEVKRRRERGRRRGSGRGGKREWEEKRERESGRYKWLSNQSLYTHSRYPILHLIAVTTHPNTYM